MNIAQQYTMNPYQQNPYTTRPMYTQTSNGITWVQGVEGAKAYQLMPNSNIVLMDSENDGVFYIKVSDNIGMCNLRTFKYEEVNNASKIEESKIDLSNYITRDELNNILEYKFNGGELNNGKQTLQSIKLEQTNYKQSSSNSNS